MVVLCLFSHSTGWTCFFFSLRLLSRFTPQSNRSDTIIFTRVLSGTGGVKGPDGDLFVIGCYLLTGLIDIYSSFDCCSLAQSASASTRNLKRIIFVLNFWDDRRWACYPNENKKYASIKRRCHCQRMFQTLDNVKNAAFRHGCVLNTGGINLLCYFYVNIRWIKQWFLIFCQIILSQSTK